MKLTTTFAKSLINTLRLAISAPIAVLGLGACADPGVAGDSEDGTVRHSCSPTDAPPADGSLRQDGATGEREDATALGMGWGHDFDPIESNQSVKLQYGSQAGMGLPVVLRLAEADVAELTRVEMRLIIDQAPIGSLLIEFPDVICSGEQGFVDAMLMVDVIGHPTIASVAQLDGRAAFVDIELFSGSDVLHQDMLAIFLAL